MAYKPKVLTVPESGSGDSSFTPFTPICGGATSTSPLQSIASLGNDGDVYTSAGAGQLGAFLPALKNCYVWFFQTGFGSPLDGDTCYITQTQPFNKTTSSLDTRLYIPASCSIKRVYGNVNVVSTLGSSENCTLRILVNGSVATNITTTLTLNATNTLFNNTSLNIALVAGDYFEVQVLCPTWATNPTNVVMSMSIQAE